MVEGVGTHALEVLEMSAKLGIHASLENMVDLVDEMGSPHAKWAPIHIAGTNGKTSTARLIDALLRAHGQKAGLGISPHLIALSERIIIDGHEISDAAFGEALDAVVQAAQRRFVTASSTNEPQSTNVTIPITEFEYITAATFEAFAQEEVDFGVVEAGIGGRWDATSVIQPAVAVITSVGLDHTDLLGDTLEDIAADKAHIIKPGCTAIIGDGLDGLYELFSNRAAAVGASLRVVREVGLDSPVIEELTTRYVLHESTVSSDLVVRTRVDVVTALCDYGAIRIPAPSYQARNVATAITAAEAALGRPLNPELVRQCLENFTYPGRFEVLSRNPLVVFDGAHNPQAMHQLVDIISQAGIQPVIALGGFKDKNFEEMIQILDPVASGYIVLSAPSARALGPNELADLLRAKSSRPVIGTCIYPSLETLKDLAGESPVIVTGSLSLYSLIKSSLDCDKRP